MDHHTIENDNKSIKAVTYLGVVANIVLSVLKIAVGAVTNSMALVADGIHSISDIATDVAVLLGVHYASKAPDKKHPYGHGRFETFSALVVAVILVLVGSLMIYKAAMSIAKVPDPENICQLTPAVFWVAIISIFAKEVLYHLTRKVAIKSNSSALYANAWHHRSDALSSVAVLVGFIAMRMGYAYGDQIATVVVGLMVIMVGAHITRQCIDEFLEKTVDNDTIIQIKKTIAAESRIRQWHKLRTRYVGREVFVDMHILVDPDLNIADAHEIAESLETALHNQIPRPINITIHVEPDSPELRK